MAQLVTIRDNVRINLSDDSTILPSSQESYQDSELNYFIGVAYRYYYNLLIQLGAGYFETTTNIALVAGQEAYDLSVLNPIYRKTSSLEKRTSNMTIPLFERERRFDPNYINYPVSTESAEYTYRFQGRTTLVIEPTPQINEAAGPTTGLKLDYIYIPDFPNQNSPDDFEFDLSFPVDAEPLVELRATISALDARDGSGALSDQSSYKQMLVDMQLQFLETISPTEFPDAIGYDGMSYSDTIF